ncbi:MAG: fibronectin type III domain-containing protein [Anaerolineae bacterium]|nr:fibronectin type III domain-containing protein [Anaerolineae bacterium]
MMKKPVSFLAISLLVLSLWSAPATAQSSGSVIFWSDGGPVAVTRATGRAPQALLDALLAGPTPTERAAGIWSAIPGGTTLLELTTDAAERPTLTVRLDVPFDALRTLDPDTHEMIVQQIGATLEPLHWETLYVQVWDPIADGFVPLSTFLPRVDPPRKASVTGGEETTRTTAQPPASGQGQPQGALSGKTVYVSAGHGWEWDCSYWVGDTCAGVWRWEVQRIPYPRPPYVGPIIEDHNNAEAVDQYLLQYLWNAGATVIPVRERDMNPHQAIVNNDDGGPGYVEDGAWTTSTTHYGYDLTFDQTYRYTGVVTGSATATATWSASLPADGRYAVYVWYRPGTNRASDAHYIVRHAGGETLVTVNQQHHGLTWHYIGSYGFRADQPAQVLLTNQSTTPDTVVIADAVRFGGGTYDTLTPDIETSAAYAPDEPWWEIAAYYYTQRMGMEPAYGDVTARPIYARWEHAGTGEDAVYVSWHTNGATGYQWTSRGTVSIVHNGEGNPVTPGSYDLRAAIHNELLNDIRAGWDPTWPGYLRAMNLGELRELWDPDPAVALPGALIEIAYHDHPDDTDALKEPAFLLLTSRAVYQGILHYFDPGAVELPEPPTHPAVQNAGSGQVRISWQPSPTDDAGLVGDAATGYRIYTSTDGIGWSNGIDVGNTTAYTLTGLAAEQILFVRVSATNAGGESFPTETLAARTGDAHTLLVSGFDRINRTMTVPDYYAITAETHLRVFLDQMNRYAYTVHHGSVITLPFDSASNEAVQTGMVNLDDYAIVDWILGEEATQEETLNAVEQALLGSYLDGGGSLFISGTEIGWDLDYLGSTADRTFYNGALRASYAGDDAGTYTVAPAAGSIFEGLAAFRFDAPDEYDADYPDQLTPFNGATVALAYQGGGGGSAAVQYADGCQRLVHFGFPFETILPADRPAVMARVLGFLGECTVLPLQTAIAAPENGAFYETPPAVSGTASGGSGVAAVEVSLCRQSDGLCWDGAGWISATTWLSATGTTAWSYTLPALAEGEYTVQARARDAEGYVDPTPAAVSFRVLLRAERAFLPLVLAAPHVTCQDVVADGGFEEGNAWTLNYLAAYDVAQVYAGARSARVGIPPGEPGGGALAYSSVRQQISLPAGSRATLRMWLYPSGEGGDTDDTHYVVFYDQVGGYHVLSTWQSDTRTWEQHTFDLSPYLGQTITLYIGTKNDGDDDTSSLYIDNVTLEVCP